MNRSLVLSLVLAPLAAHAERRTLTLSDALSTGDSNVPAVRQARADSDAQKAQADINRSPLLPQLNGTALYRRATSNFAPSPGQVPNAVNMTGNISGATYNYFNFGLVLSQTIFDAPTFVRWRSALATLGAFKAQVETARLDVAYNVRLNFFGARAAHALVAVAKETLENQRRHLEQVQGFVDVGTRPEIDLAQSKTDVANAQVSLITAENNDETSKAQLNLAMGIETDTNYDIGAGEADPVDLEDASIDEQMKVAVKTRPELIAFDERLHAQALAITGARWGYAPTVGASTSITDAGQQIDNMAWNWNFQAQLGWQLFGGLITYSQTKQAQAQLESIKAQRDAQHQQVRLELERARLAVRAAKASLLATAEALANARLREQLAEGRYKAGVGNAIEISDAVLALANAGAQRVQAELNVADARAQLLRALGRR